MALITRRGARQSPTLCISFTLPLSSSYKGKSEITVTDTPTGQDDVVTEVDFGAVPVGALAAPPTRDPATARRACLHALRVLFFVERWAILPA